jgi:hypothetical protein
MFTSEEQFFLLLIKPFLIGALAGLVFATIDSRRNKSKQFKFTDVLVAIPIVLIAYIAGYLTGISGSSAIGNLVPAVLAFIGGLNLYMFGAKADHRALTIFSIFLFAITLFYGVLDGRYDRANGIEAQMEASAIQELRIKTFRQNLTLPPDPPSWVTTGP